MITWIDVITQAFNKMGTEKVNIKSKPFVVKVGEFARDAKKIHQPDIDRKIGIVISTEGKDFFKKIEKDIYILINSTHENYDNKIEKENEGYENLDKILEDQGISETERLVMIKARIGQGWFRKKLYEKRKECYVTGYKQIELLIASHIKPWKDSSHEERLDVDNGLLLTANLDKAFDRGLVTFADDGKIILSEDLAPSEIIGIKPDMKLRKITKKNKEYLNYHSKKIFKDRDTQE